MNTIKFLSVSLIVLALVVLVANLFGVESATLVGNLLYVPIAGTFVVVTVLVFSRFGLGGTYGKAWLFFVIFSVLWFVAEMISVFFHIYGVVSKALQKINFEKNYFNVSHYSSNTSSSNNFCHFGGRKRKSIFLIFVDSKLPNFRCYNFGPCSNRGNSFFKRGNQPFMVIV